MKRFFVLAALAASAFSACADYLIEDPDGSIKKTINGEEYTFSSVSESDTYSVQYDASWWYTPDESEIKKRDVKIYVSKKDGQRVEESIEVKPTDTWQDIEDAINTKITTHSAEVAFQTAARALAKSLYNEIHAEIMQENIETLAKTLQADLFGDVSSTYQNFTTDDGETIKVVDTSLVDTSASKQISQLKQARAQFGTKSGSDVSHTSGELIREGKVSLGGAGGSAMNVDVNSITNLSDFYTPSGKYQTNTLAIAGWWHSGSNQTKPDENFICDFDLSYLGKEDKDKGNFALHYFLTRTENGTMHYLPATNCVKALVKPDDSSIGTNLEGIVSIYNFGSGETEEESLAKKMIVKKDNAGGGDDFMDEYEEEEVDDKYHILTRKISDGETNLVYLSIGKEMQFVSDITNEWAFITNTCVMVTNNLPWMTNVLVSITNDWNWMTNLSVSVSNDWGSVTNTMHNVTNVFDFATNTLIMVTNEIPWMTNTMIAVTNDWPWMTNTMIAVTNDWPWMTNSVITITNTWGWVTNEVVTTTNCLYRPGGVTNMIEVFSHFTNIIIRTTNQFTKAINIANGFDNQSTWTNGDALVEIKGFHKVANEFTTENKPVPYLPLRVPASQDPKEARLDWTKYETYTNALKSLFAAFKKLGKNKGTTIEFKPDFDVNFNDIISPENSENPANEGFDDTDTSNPWNLIYVKGDSDFKPSGYKELNTIEWLGNHGTAYGNALSLYNAWTAKKYSYPEIYRNSDTIELQWKGKYIADSESSDSTANKTLDVKQEAEADTDCEKRYMLGLYGFLGADSFSVPYKSGTKNTYEGELKWSEKVQEATSANPKALLCDGSKLTWGEVGGGSPTDEATVTTNYNAGAVANGNISLYGWRTAETGAVPQKGQDGKLTWFKSSAATNIYLAGAGIQITDNGGGVSTISALDYNEGGSGTDASTVTLTVITQCQYDEETHKFQVKTRNITFYGTAEDEDDEWTDVFEAVSHASEHQDSGSSN